MKDFVLWLAFLCFALIILPGLAVLKFKPDTDNKSAGHTITLYNTADKTVTEIELEDYLTGVVSAEMPASFSDEALKAQSVAARSYAMRKINSDTAEHHGADLCTDYAHCQAYIDEEAARKNWKSDYEKNTKKISNAVEATAGEYLRYGDDIAITVFHSSSNGITEKSADVWGGDIPYLTNVESGGDLERKDYCVKTEFTVDEFRQKVSADKVTDDSTELIGKCTYTAGNNVDTIVLCNQTFKGTEVRKIFGLRSTSFEISRADDKIIFATYGNGHGVGMSQYGADAMAKNGEAYTEILAHYYPGTELANMYN